MTRFQQQESQNFIFKKVDIDVYYNRTNYELAYRITQLDNGEIIIIITAGTRENFYKELKRYMQ